MNSFYILLHFKLNGALQSSFFSFSSISLLVFLNLKILEFLFGVMEKEATLARVPNKQHHHLTINISREFQAN
jgi:hypothetical protein